MEKLTYGIAVVIGWLIWQASGNIYIAVLVALALEGVVFAVLAAVDAKRKTAQEQLATWQAGEGIGSPPPARRLWWRIVVLVILGLPAIATAVGLVVVVTAISLEDEWGSVEPAFLVLYALVTAVLCITALLALSSLIKATKWNKTLRQLPPL